MPRMKAVTFCEFGGPDVLQLAEVERPEPGPDDVLVRIDAAGICHHDVLSRGGRIPGAPGRMWVHAIDRGRIFELEHRRDVLPDRIVDGPEVDTVKGWRWS